MTYLKEMKYMVNGMKMLVIQDWKASQSFAVGKYWKSNFDISGRLCTSWHAACLNKHAMDKQKGEFLES